jgi:hypothetical protein
VERRCPNGLAVFQQAQINQHVVDVHPAHSVRILARGNVNDPNLFSCRMASTFRLAISSALAPENNVIKDPRKNRAISFFSN